MIRTRRKPPPPEQLVITPAMALEWETTGTWPRGGPGQPIWLGWRELFWSGETVPAELRPERRPDPRRVLGVEDEWAHAAALRVEVEAFQAARIAWLEREVARAENGAATGPVCQRAADG